MQAKSVPVQAGNADPWSPPPYTPQHPSNAPVSRASSSGDSPYSFLREFDTVFLVDDSGSMRGRRWQEAADAIAAIAPTADNVREIFYGVEPRGATPAGSRLRQILDPYLRRVEAIAAQGRDPSESVKPLNIITITDGVFTDDAESVIINAAKRLDKCNATPWQVGLQFFQVGDDKHAQEYLQMLDDDLGHKSKNGDMRDIVDTVPWRGDKGQTLSADGILKCVLGAVNRKYDKCNAFR
ncbi:hypothetical protein APSETT444_008512 [Aspergillus pseudonomiae]